MKSMRKLLVFVFLFVFSIILTACGSSDGTTKKPTPAPDPSDKSLVSIFAKYKNNTYNFDGNVTIEYDEDFVFNQSDFILTAIYSDSSTETVTPTSFGIYDSSDTKIESNYLPGSYSIKFTYSNLNALLTFTIEPVDINNVTISGVNTSYDYTGDSINPEVVLTYNNKTLVEDTDYIIAYGQNITQSGSITISGIGLYQNTKTIDFTINNLDPIVPTFTNKSYDYDGTNRYNEVCPDLSSLTTTGIANIYYNVTKNSESVYKIKDKGTYNISVSYAVLDGYKEVNSTTFTVTIGGVSIENATTSEIDFTYTGSAPTENELWGFTVTVNDIELVYQIDFTVELNEGEGIDNINASTSTTHASIIITGIGNYTGTKTVNFNIKPKSAQYLSVEIDYDSYYDQNYKNDVYDGSAKTLTVTSVKFGDTDLVLDTDYTITYTDNIQAGTAYLNINGIGNFNGTASYQFAIFKKEIEFDTITVTGNGYKVYDGSPFNCIITNLPTGVLASYEYYYYDYPTGEERTKVVVQEVIEPRNDGYYCHYQLSLSQENDSFGYRYDVNYYLSGSEEGYYDVAITLIQATIEFNDPAATEVDGNIHYEYKGSAIIPVIIVKDYNNNVVDSSEYTIVIKKEIWEEIEPNSYEQKVVESDAINAGWYYIEIISNHYAPDGYRIFYIDKIDLTNEQKSLVSWPKEIIDIYINNRYLDNSGAVPFIADSSEYKFYIGEDEGWPCIVLEMKNYNNYNLAFDDIVYGFNNTIFEYFKVNGTALSADEIYNIIMKYDEVTYTRGNIKYGDYIEIKMKDGYYVTYANGYDTQSDKSTEASFYAGIGNNNYYLGQFTIYIYIDEEVIGYSLTDANCNTVFDGFYIDGISVLINPSFYEFDSEDNGIITLTVRDGYKAQYSYSTDGLTEVVKVEKTQTLTTNYLISEGTGYVDIFKDGSDTPFLRVKVVSSINN